MGYQKTEDGTAQYQLSPAERALALWVAKSRSRVNRSAGVSRNIPNEDQAFFDSIERLGVEAEMAFAGLVNAYPRLFSASPVSAANGTDPGDVTYKGLTFDVKATRHPKGRLLWPEDKPTTGAHIAVLMGEVEPGLFEVVGAIETHKIKTPAHWADELPRPCYAVPRSALATVRETINRHKGSTCDN